MAPCCVLHYPVVSYTMTTSTKQTTTWPYESNQLTPTQRARMQEFYDDIKRSRRNNDEGYGFHIWLDGRLHDSAVTWSDAFDECRAQRRSGFQGPIVIGSGATYGVTHMGGIDGVSVRVELPA
jgi:hypothetical protein